MKYPFKDFYYWRSPLSGMCWVFGKHKVLIRRDEAIVTLPWRWMAKVAVFALKRNGR
jgi:hypothetical protein